MANSYAHQLGEFIGSFFENSMKKPIRTLSKNNGLFFDSYGYREARGKDKITWEDIHGSHHDLDYVIEDGGTKKNIGKPVAFIELAWRRYTKHSKNKVQEIQGAIDPIYEKYKDYDPFKGAILCGEFTQNSIEQLRDDGFHVLYIPYNSLVSAFKKYNIDILYGEDTKETWFKNSYENIKAQELYDKNLIKKIAKKLINDNKKEINKFLEELSIHFNRCIKFIRVLPLHGTERDIDSLDKAISFIENYGPTNTQTYPLKEFVVWVVYNNGDSIKGDFSTKEATINFLSKQCK